MTTDRPGTPHNAGVQISGGTQHGAIAGGPQARAIVHHASPAPVPAADLPPAQQELLEAVVSLRRDLTALLAERPGVLEPDAARDAEQNMTEAESEAELAQPREGALRRRVHAVADALGSVGALAAGVTAVQAAFDRLFSSG
ncbi:hypothetical protein SALBM135S_02972 [Streptomyces alboniger]